MDSVPKRTPLPQILTLTFCPIPSLCSSTLPHTGSFSGTKTTSSPFPLSAAVRNQCMGFGSERIVPPLTPRILILLLLLLLFQVLITPFSFPYSALPLLIVSTNSVWPNSVWEVKGGNLIKLFLDHVKDVFIASNPGLFSGLSSMNPSQFPTFLWNKCKDLLVRLMLPEGYPNSVTNDYLENSLWRGVQGVACQVSRGVGNTSIALCCWIGKRGYSHCCCYQLGAQGWVWVPQQDHVV